MTPDHYTLHISQLTHASLRRYTPQEIATHPDGPTTYLARTTSHWIAIQVMKAEMHAFQLSIISIMQPNHNLWSLATNPNTGPSLFS